MAEAETTAAPGVATDPLRSFRFIVEVQGFGNARFTSVSGMGVQVEAIKYQAGGDIGPTFCPGPVDYAEITLAYGLTQSDMLWDWLIQTAHGVVDRREVSVIMLDPAGVDQVLRWNLTRAWPTRWSGAPLEALGKSLAIESLTLVYEGIERDTTGAPNSGPPAGAPGA